MGFASGSTAAMPSASNTRRLESLKADDPGGRCHCREGLICRHRAESAEGADARLSTTPGVGPDRPALSGDGLAISAAVSDAKAAHRVSCRSAMKRLAELVAAADFSLMRNRNRRGTATSHDRSRGWGGWDPISMLFQLPARLVGRIGLRVFDRIACDPGLC